MRPIDLQLTPDEAIAAWPAETPLAVLWSGGPAAPFRYGWPRGVVLARPGGWAIREVGDAGRWLLPPSPAGFEADHGGGGDLRGWGGWIGMIGYGAGREVEPTACARGPAGGPEDAADSPVWPVTAWARVDDALIFDPAGGWFATGTPPRVGGSGGGGGWGGGGGFSLGRLRSLTGRGAFERDVARIIELIHAGDVFQANLTHRLRGRFAGGPRGLFRALAARASPWYGAYMELPDAPDGRRRVIASASPELFLAYDARTRTAVTRPMKGTRATDDTGARAALEGSPKDRAELAMIVDLMRNDLGRVCAPGTIRVTDPRAIELHGAGTHGGRGVLQAVATVEGRVREGLDREVLVRACFPPGSVTGAPKVRAMQIIDELEPVPRGPYCGCIGFLGDSGGLTLSVAIRTAMISGARVAGEPGEVADGALEWAVGAGIVADSDPEEEWRETLAKAGVIRGVVSRRRARPAAPRSAALGGTA